MRKLVVLAVRIYQLFSRAGLPRCRYYPSCSQYTIEAIELYGAFPGLWMGAKRILRCHPLHKGGYDPVPKY